MYINPCCSTEGLWQSLAGMNRPKHKCSATSHLARDPISFCSYSDFILHIYRTNKSGKIGSLVSNRINKWIWLQEEKLEVARIIHSSACVEGLNLYSSSLCTWDSSFWIAIWKLKISWCCSAMLPSCQSLKMPMTEDARKSDYGEKTDSKSEITVELKWIDHYVQTYSLYNIYLMIKCKAHSIFLKETKLGTQTNYAKTCVSISTYVGYLYAQGFTLAVALGSYLFIKFCWQSLV